MMKHWISYRLDEAEITDSPLAMRVYYKHAEITAYYNGYLKYNDS